MKYPVKKSFIHSFSPSGGLYLESNKNRPLSECFIFATPVGGKTHRCRDLTNPDTRIIFEVHEGPCGEHLLRNRIKTLYWDVYSI